MLATSVRSTGTPRIHTGTPRIQLPQEQAETDCRSSRGPWSHDLRESILPDSLFAQADAKAVKWHEEFAVKRASNPEYRPSRRGDDADLWRALNKYSINKGSYRMDVPTLGLFTLQPDLLGGAGAKFYGE
eukprot:7740471-Pyramimonas_sp.AAC.1